MKIKVKEENYDKVLTLVKRKHLVPRLTSPFLKGLIKLLSKKELKDVNFKYEYENMDGISTFEPCLYLMNHSSFIDLKIAFRVIKHKSFNIICTDDGFVGKYGLMRALGCIPTTKFITDTVLVKDMVFATKKLKSSILLYPEASYSFDGTATPLPTTLGKLVKFLNVPVVMIKTSGAFLRDPLYNNLQIRDTNVSAKIKCIIKKDDIKSKSADELFNIINSNFQFDNFKDQQENNIVVDEPFRADYLNRALYKCPHCLKEGQMEGKGIYLACTNCNEKYELTETGFLKNTKSNEGKFIHVPAWYNWERECVREEIINGTYKEEMDVEIYVFVNYKKIYKVGVGHLTHNLEGFSLVGLDGRINYTQSSTALYSLYSDFNWYEIGDIVCIGEYNMRYYCKPINKKDIVTKLRLATEEIYKLRLVKNN